MEHNHGGLVQISFLSKWVICRFQPLIFQGVRVYLSSTNLGDGLLLMVDLTSGVFFFYLEPQGDLYFCRSSIPKTRPKFQSKQGAPFGFWVHIYLEPQTTINKRLFQLDDSKSLHRKCLEITISIHFKLVVWGSRYYIYIASIQQTKRSLENPQPQVDHRSTRVEWSFLPTKMQRIWST